MLSGASERPSILIVEDETGPRDALKIILRPFYRLHTVETAAAALRLLKEQPVDLVTLDLKLPDRQGTDLLQQIKREQDDVEVIIITGYGSLRSAMEGLRYGAAGYLLKPFNVTELIKLIDQTLGKKRRLDRLRGFLRTGGALWSSEQDVAGVWKLVREIYGTSEGQESQPHAGAPGGPAPMPLLSDLLLARDCELYRHACRVSSYAALLADALTLSEVEHRSLETGAFLHDLGLLGVPGLPLGSALHPEEPRSEGMRHHPDLGARMVPPLTLPAEVTQIIAYHHERFDGSGYPHSLQGEGIPLMARIVGLADGFDHLLAGLPALPVDDAIAEVHQRSGSHFDPELVSAFVRSAAESRASLPTGWPLSRPASTPSG